MLGTGISAVRLPDVLEYIDQCVQAGHHQHVCVCTVNNVMSARKDPQLARIQTEAGLCLPDGSPLARAGRRRYGARVEQVRGTDLVLALAPHAAAKGHRVFLYGAGPGVAQEMATRLINLAPGLQVAGTESPPMGVAPDQHDPATAARINEARPHIVLVGLPTPKQEKWMDTYKPHLGANILIGVGAAFDFVAGTKRAAPRALRRMGLEWSWRFLQEPRRLWRRVLVQGPKFVALSFTSWIWRSFAGKAKGGASQEDGR